VNFADKIHSLRSAKLIIADLKKSGQKVIFTNGCFDLLHRGHISYLEKARQLGDYLIVGLNSDDSVRRLKGKGRPIKQQASREAVLAGLGAVDMVIVFSEDTPETLIEALKPDVLVKGGDYKIAQIVGAEFVMNRGGLVKVIDFVDGFSSTSIIKNIKSE